MIDPTSTPLHARQVLDDLEASVVAMSTALRERRADDAGSDGTGGIEPPD